MSIRVAALVESAWHRVPGGVASSTHHSLHAAAAEPDIDVLGFHAWHRGRAADGLEPTVPTVTMPLPRAALYDLWHRTRRPGLTRWVGDVDVVHAPTAIVPPPGAAALVATIHDLAFLDAPERSTSRGARLATRGFELARDEATLVTVPSESTMAACVVAGIDAGRVRVVPWGCAPVVVDDADRARVRSRFDLPADFVLWVGTLEPRKNLAGLLEAHAAVPDISLVVVGPDGWGELPIEDSPRVRRLGAVSTADLAVLYDLATVFALPSHAEGFGLPVLEAMAQGTAVVTSSGTATEELVGDAGLTVAAGDNEALAAAIVGLLADDGDRQRRGVAGRERAAHYTWHRTGTLLADVYREAVT